ncbi:16S rRNA (guanine527-N7)-methyltransferase [Thiohalospira halophila DSM 15071]|uniref:Ribosomal RNA small subunit methyltransferase G n=1 Tax=Thiohalospira halophila DSM 15071 TaxID=1123397 RepID=A0A1I1REG8_9GAMM|nr:16S rRNA (guanine(527)-N(7))-methyltransferase RsmG [Thiohalospira halophila]SFD32751.1 16S rRNA (guanine527-N7)-methyltransferase [Thiohalospira halophila DSM 15071]
MSKGQPAGYNRAEELRRGLAALGQELPELAQERLLTYLDLLARWNRVHNLTAVRDPEAMVAYHLLDSLAGRPWLPEGPLVDLGTGAGLPGLVLAIAEPDRPVTLVDSAAKRTRFLHQVVGALGLERVEVFQARMEAWRPAEPVEVVTARALTSMPELVELAAPLLTPTGRLVAWKGVWPEAGAEGVAVEAVHPVTVPGIDGARHIVVARPGV